MSNTVEFFFGNSFTCFVLYTRLKMPPYMTGNRMSKHLTVGQFLIWHICTLHTLSHLAYMNT